MCQSSDVKVRDAVARFTVLPAAKRKMLRCIDLSASKSVDANILSETVSRKALIKCQARCFIVFSEAYPPRQFALYSLRETHSTKEDIKTSVELRRYLGTLLLSEEPWVTNYLHGRQPYKWLDSDFAHGVNALIPSMKFGVEPYLTHYQPLYNNKACHVKYSFPATAAFQFGGDRRLLVACAIVDKYRSNSVRFAACTDFTTAATGL